MDSPPPRPEAGNTESMRHPDGRPPGRLAIPRRGFLAGLGLAAAGAAGVGFRHVRRDPAPEEPDPWAGLEYAAGPPQGARVGVSRMIWSAETTEPVVALTFDDGPFPDLTEPTLRILQQFGVPASFQLMGYNAQRHPDLVHEHLARGHEITNHTWTHLELSSISPPEVERQILLSHEAIEAITGMRPRFFRPPRGQVSGFATRYAAELGYDILYWSVGRGVPGEGTPEAVARHVVESLQPGDIVGLHDGIGRETFNTDIEHPGPIRRRRDVELSALPWIIEGILDRGFRLATVSGLLEVAEAAP